MMFGVITRVWKLVEQDALAKTKNTSIFQKIITYLYLFLPISLGDQVGREGQVDLQPTVERLNQTFKVLY